MTSDLYVYDIETYPNVFTCGVQRLDNGHRWIFEISDRHDHAVPFIEFLSTLAAHGCRMVGFNNEGFDYPVIHHMWNVFHARGTVTAQDAYEKADAIINGPYERRWDHMVWPSDRVVKQVDVFKIMHFDNMARSTSLKKLELNMRSASVEDLPYKPGVPLTVDQIPLLIDYMCHDIAETAKFMRLVQDNLTFRDALSEQYEADMTNFNDTKIGKEFFIRELERAGVRCYDRSSGRREPRQTRCTDGIRVADRLLPVPFSTPDMQRMYQFFQGAVIPADQTKGFFKDLTANIGPFEMHFGAGGIHGSVSRRTFRSSETHQIIDVDVTSYYPSLAIVNRWFPEHLSEKFCDVYADLKARRVSYAKGSPENKMLKLALNGVYGDSNNKYSPFYDPAYTMAITINGQMLLAWLAERVADVPGIEIIQINTDGLTVYLPRENRKILDQIRQEWQTDTGLDLEDVEYETMAVRDVNNYVSISTDGKVKRKNAYLTEPEWHQDHSSLVVPRGFDAWLRRGVDPTTFVYGHDDPFDFMRHVKVPRSSTLWCGDEQVQGTSRYYIALAGRPLVKHMPPLKDNTTHRKIGIDTGWSVAMCNRASDFDWTNLNRRWYIQEINKLIEGVGGTTPARADRAEMFSE